MTKGDLQNSLTEAMKRLVDYTKNTSDSALVVEATIVDIIDEGVGEYSVEYFGNTFSVYSNSRDAVYSIGDNVYISVPERDFSKTKLIIGLSNPQNAVFTNNDNKTIYCEVSDNLITNDFGIIEFCSYETTKVDNQPISGYSSTNFSKILNSYKTFSFSCSVKTKLPIEQQNSGIYGLTLNVPLEINAAAGGGRKEVVWKSFPLDTTNMMGSFYRFEEWTPQTVYFELDSQYKISDFYVPTLSYYCYDFIQDPSKTEKDIFIKDIALYAVEEFSELDESGYGLTLKASEGPYFGQYFSANKTLTPTLRYNRKIVKLTESNSEIYWFKECVDIRNTSEYYNSYGGFGWKCLNPKTNIAMNSDGTQTFSWITSNLTLNVPRTEVPLSTRYKCVIVYKQTRISAIIELKDLDSTTTFELTAKDGNTVLIKDTGYAHLIATVYIDDITDKDKYRNSVIYSWMRYDKNGNYINDEDGFFEVVRYNEIVDGKYETEIQFPVNKIEDLTYVYCSATFIDDNLYKELLGTRSIALSTSTLYEYNLIIENDDLIYKYDTNGDSPAGTAYDGPSTSKVTDIAPLNYTIKKASGEDFSGEEYVYVYFKWTVPKDSMFEIKAEDYAPEDGQTEGYPIGYFHEDENNYYLEGYDNFNHTYALLKYKIKSRYNLAQADAAIILQVAFKDRVLTAYANINFIKEGMNGTNGTAYAARLVAGGINASDTRNVPYGTPDVNGFAQKLKFVYNMSNPSDPLYYYDYNDKRLYSWQTVKKRIYPRVFENSSELTYGTEYTVTYSMFDENITKPCFEINNIDSTGGVLLELKEQPQISNKPCNILQAKITVIRGNSSVSNSQEVIYVYYPIELTITNMVTNVIPTIDGGFAEVMYATDGTNPSWDQTSPFMIRENQKLEVVDYYKVQWEAQHHIKPGRTEDLTDLSLREVHFAPDNKYDDGNSKNYVAATMIVDESKIDSINAEITALQQQNEDLDALRNEVQSNLSYLEDFANLFDYNHFMTELDTVKPLLDIQTNMVYSLNTITSAIGELNDYLNTQAQYGSKPITTICASLISQKNALQVAVDEAIDNTRSLGDGTHTFNTLVSLESKKISWNDEIKNTYTQELGIDITLNLELLITNINQMVNAYQVYYNQIDTAQNRQYLDEYIAIVNGIESACSCIPNTAYPRFVEIRNRVLKYLDYFNILTSVKDLKNCINLIVLDILSPTFDLVDGVLITKQITLDELSALDIYYASCIENNNITIYNLECILDTRGQYGIFHIRPIVIYLNRYSMSNINAWDGNKIETGDGNYLLAPQVGAGYKEQDNSFTGIVIGQRNLESVSSAANVQTGMFGYVKGKQSLFLNAKNGSAIFGVAGNGGQIIIDPSSENNARSLLYSSNYWKNYNNKTGLPTTYAESNVNNEGLCIDLKDSNIHLAGLSDDGNKGKIYSGTHKTLKSSETGFYLSHLGFSITNGNSQFTISTAAGEYPKLFSNGKSTLTNTSSGFYLSQDGLSIGSTIALFNNNGGAYLRLGAGALTSSQSCWTIGAAGDSSYISCDKGGGRKVFISTDAIQLGNYFSVTNDGTLNAARGSVGGFWLSSDNGAGGSPGFFNVNKTLAISSSDGAIGCWPDGHSWPDSVNYSWMLNKHGADFKVPINFHGQSIVVSDGVTLAQYIENVVATLGYAKKGTYSFSGSASCDPKTGSGTCSGSITI